MALIQVTDLTFGYDGSYDHVFEKVSFQVDTDWKLGFIGRNGRGKTTFLNLLMGKYKYQGTIAAGVQFDYFPYHIADRNKYTYEIIEEIYPDYEMWKVRKELFLLGMEEELLYRIFNTLSNGEQTRVMMAVLFSKENNFLLIDEPTNHLDTEGREEVARYLNNKSGFILVSHDSAFLDGCIDHVLSVNKDGIEVQKGNFTSWNQNRLMKEQFEKAENERLQKEVRQLSAAAMRTERWSDQIEKSKIGQHAGDRGYIGHKSAKMMKRSKAIEQRRNQAAEDKEKLLKNTESAEELKMFPVKHHQNLLAEAEDLCPLYEGKAAGAPISFRIEQGDIAVLHGRNGSGKSSILKLITGIQREYRGKLRLASGLKISYVPQDTSFLKGALDEYIEVSGIESWLFKAVLRKLDFSRVQFDKRMEEYSEGQKKKILLAESISTPAHLYIWDEPLNYVDIFSRMQLKELIRSYRPTMLLVEHDKNFINDIENIRCL